MAFASSIRLPRLADVTPCQPCLLLQDGQSFDDAKTVRLVGALLRRIACPTCLVWCKSDSLVRGRLTLRYARAQLFSGAKDIPCGRHGPAVHGNLPALIRVVDSEVSRVQNADAPGCRWLPWRSSGQARSWGMLSSTRLRGTGRLAWTASYACRRQRCHSQFATVTSPSMCMADGDSAPYRAAHASQLLRFEQPTFLNKAAAQAKGCPLCASKVIAMHHEMASPTVTAAAHSGGKAVYAFTANTPAMMHAVLDARVDAVVTDVPQQLMQV